MKRSLFTIPGGTYDVDVCRIVFYSLMFWWFYATRFESYAAVPTSLYLPVGLPLPPPAQPWIGMVKNLWLASLFCSALGLFTWVSGWIAFLLGFYLLGLDWAFGNTHHSHHALVMCLLALAFARPAQHLSLDRRLGLQPRTVTDESWCVRICQLSWCLMFFNAGLAKLRHSGWHFCDAANFQNILLLTQQWYARDSSLLHESVRAAVFQSSLLASLLAASGLIFELLAPLAFWLPGRWRWVIVGAIAFLQVGAYLLFYISGFKKTTAAYVFWIPWTAIYRRFQERSGPAANSEEDDGS